MRYVQRMTRDRATQLAREYWFELLFGAIGVAAVIELILPPGASGRNDARLPPEGAQACLADSPGDTHWKRDRLVRPRDR